MTFYRFVLDYFEGGSLENFLKDEPNLRKAGFFGYLVGLFSVFTAFKVMGLVPGGILSFMFFFLLIAGFNYLFSSMTNLFLDMVGHRYSSSNLFYFFGLSEYLWIFALPLAFFCKAGYLSFGLVFVVLVYTVIFARLKILKKIYSIRYKMAFLSFVAPYAVFSFVLFFGFGYMVYWTVGLMMK